MIKLKEKVTNTSAYEIKCDYCARDITLNYKVLNINDFEIILCDYTCLGSYIKYRSNLTICEFEEIKPIELIKNL